MSNTLPNPEIGTAEQLMRRRKFTVLDADVALQRSSKIIRAAQLRAYVPEVLKDETVVADAQKVQNYPEYVPQEPQDNSIAPETTMEPTISEENSVRVADARAYLKQIQGNPNDS